MPPKKAETQVTEPTTETVKAPKAKTAAKKDASSSSAADLAIAAIKKKYGLSPTVAYTGSLPCVPSGSFAVDDLIGGVIASDGKPKCPGFPRKRITEVFGAEASGKTTGALQAIAEVQRAGGCAMFLDFEHALDHAYAKAVGVSFDPKKLMLYEPDSLEDGMKFLYVAIYAGVDLVVIDSVSAMIPASEREKGADDASAIGAQARAFSRFMPLICAWLCDKKALARNPAGTALILINQIRATISKGGPGAGMGPETNTSGGKAIKFYAYIRLLYTRIKSEFVEKKNRFNGKTVKVAFGNHTQVRMIKSKVDAKVGQSADIFIRFGQGIDDALSLIEAGVNHKLIKKGDGGRYILDGQSFHGRENLRTHLKDNRKVFDALRKKVIDCVQAGGAAAEDDEDELEIDDSIFEVAGDDTSEETDVPAAEEVTVESSDADDTSDD